MSHRHGHTIAGLLVVIGILLFLLATMLVAFRAIRRSVQIASTRVALQNLQSMADELRASGCWNLIEAANPPSCFTLDATSVLPEHVYVGGEDRFQDSGVLQTSVVMGQLLRVPMNAKAVSSLPPAAFLEHAPAGVAAAPQFPVLLDAWGNPILFIPSGGATHLWSGGIWHGPDNPLVSPNGQAFFVSAGPDGDFVEGDDNIYSFD